MSVNPTPLHSIWYAVLREGQYAVRKKYMLFYKTGLQIIYKNINKKYDPPVCELVYKPEARVE